MMTSIKPRVTTAHPRGPEVSAHAAQRVCIENLRFTRRRESWVAASNGRFFKLVRKSNDPLRDRDDPACIAIAERECADMRFLHSLDDAACCPLQIDGACIVYPYLAGPDMRDLLLRRGAAAEHARCLDAAMQLLAHLHRGDVRAYPLKDYRIDGFLPPPRELGDWTRGRQRTLVITGFEARNFRFDAPRRAWCFFDPHHIWQGFPEEDFARFVISLWMLRGRRAGPRPWKRFDRLRLLAAYEAEASAKLDRRLLNYFLYEELAMRRFHALKLARRLPAVIRTAGVIGNRFYYHHLRHALASQRV